MKAQIKKQITLAIGKNIRKQREKLGLTQEKLAKLLGLTRISIVNMEQGRQHTPCYNIVALQHLFNCSYEDLFPTSNALKQISDEIKREQKIIMDKKGKILKLKMEIQKIRLS